MAEQRADEIKFFNRASGLKATNIQAAIEEVAASGGKVDLIKHISDVGSGRIITNAEREKLSAIERGATADQEASEVPYSGDIMADTVKAALDALAKKAKSLEYKSHQHENLDILGSISNSGSGNIITVDERRGLHPHPNLDVLSHITSAGSGGIITSEERNKLAGIEKNATRNQDATEIQVEVPGIPRGNIPTVISAVNDRITQATAESHSHQNSGILDSILTPGSGRVISDRERDKLDSIESGATQDQSAFEVPYSNTGSFLQSENVQGAIDETAMYIRAAKEVAHTHINEDILANIAGFGSGVIISEEEREKLRKIENGATADQAASEVPYDPSRSKLNGSNLQSAIDELAIEIGHRHDNRATLDLITDHGSGVVISKDERELLLRTDEQLQDHIRDFERHVYEDERHFDALRVKSHIHENWGILNSITSLGSGQIVTKEERNKLSAIEPNAKDDQAARDVPYDSNNCSIQALDVQGALDFLAGTTDGLILTAHAHDNNGALSGISDSGSGHVITDEERQKLASIADGACAAQKAKDVPYNDSDVHAELDSLNDKFDTVNVLNHTHENADVLKRVIGYGSGSIITDDERQKLQSIEKGAMLQSSTQVPYEGKVVGAVNVTDAIEKVGGATEAVARLSHNHEQYDELEKIMSAGSGRVITESERDKLSSVTRGAKCQVAREVPFHGETVGMEADTVHHALVELANRGSHKHDNFEALSKITKQTCITPEERKKLAGIEPGATRRQTADQIPYNKGSVSSTLTTHAHYIEDLMLEKHSHSNSISLDGISGIGSGVIISKSEREKLNSIEPNAKDDQSAAEVPYKDGQTVHAALDQCGAKLREILTYGHKHENIEALGKIANTGSGSIITQAERKKLQGIEDNATSVRAAEEVMIRDGEFSQHSVAGAIEKLAKGIATHNKQIHQHTNLKAISGLRDAGSGKVITKEERNKLNTVEPYAKRIETAADIPFSGGGLKATNLQDAIIELSRLTHVHENADVLSALTDAGSGAVISSKERDKMGNIEYNAKDDQEASEMVYDNTVSGLRATNAQAAIDELAMRYLEG